MLRILFMRSYCSFVIYAIPFLGTYIFECFFTEASPYNLSLYFEGFFRQCSLNGLFLITTSFFGYYATLIFIYLSLRGFIRG
jgi:hypothetical protein